MKLHNNQRQGHWNLSRVLVLAILASGILTGCTVPKIAGDDFPLERTEPAPVAPPKTVPRREIIETARRYAAHVWTPTEANVRHGVDTQGVHVDTPDRQFSPPGMRSGWWVLNQRNQGVPYQWGGFSTVEDFEKGIKAGYAAGDILTREKRAFLNEGLPTISQEAVGIDSSGFISRCWQLPRPYATTELPSITRELSSYDELKPGDILNLRGVHVILFEQFVDDRKKSLLGYEAGAPPSWKVLYNYLPARNLRRLGYKPLRFLYIKEDPDDELFVTPPATPIPAPEAPPTVPEPAPETALPLPNSTEA